MTDDTFAKRRDEAAEAYVKGHHQADTRKHVFKAGADWTRAECQAEIEQLRVYKKTVYDYVQGTGNTSPKTLGHHVADALVMDHKELRAEVERLQDELAAWHEIELVSGRKRSEIYGMAYKLKPGKYANPIPDIPACSMTEESVKIHDDICDILDGRAFNEDEVCTASVGVWAAIAVCEKLWRDQLREQVLKLEEHIDRLEAGK